VFTPRVLVVPHVQPGDALDHRKQVRQGLTASVSRVACTRVDRSSYTPVVIAQRKPRRGASSSSTMAAVRP
jgi:hypothetical protein